MNTNCKIKITKFVTAFLLICFVSPTFANETTVDPERSQLRKDIATTIQKAGAFGKVTVFGQDRTNGWALIDFTAEDEKDHRVFFIAGDFECLSQITPDLSDVELLCLNGDDFVGKVTAENEESTRVKGTFKNSGDAKILLNGFQISGVEELIKRLNPTEYETVSLLRDYSPQPPVSKIVANDQSSRGGNETTILKLLESIKSAEVFCSELGFDKQSGPHAICAIKFLKQVASE